MKIKAVLLFKDTGNKIVADFTPNHFEHIWNEIEFELPPEIKVVGENWLGESLFSADGAEYKYLIKDLIGSPHPTKDELFFTYLKGTV